MEGWDAEIVEGRIPGQSNGSKTRGKDLKLFCSSLSHTVKPGEVGVSVGECTMDSVIAGQG